MISAEIREIRKKYQAELKEKTPAIIAKHLERVTFEKIATELNVCEFEIRDIVKNLDIPNKGFTLDSNALDFADVMLSVRASNCLKNWLKRDYPLTLVSQIDITPDQQLLQTQNFGRKSLKELRDAIRAIKGEPEPEPVTVKRRVEIERTLVTNNQFPEHAKFYAEWEETKEG